MNAATLLAVALAVDLTPRPAEPPKPHAREETHCAACHSADGWDRVTFDHGRTGFPLEGAHRKAACRGCHREADFKVPVPKACVACHRDGHAGRLGTRCSNCHDAVAWHEPTFGPEAHRRTNFPLDGRHALLPCEECHGDVRDRAFSRPTRRCVACHAADLDRATAVAFDHRAAFGQPDECRRCHGAWSFSPGYLPGHDACFPIKSGTHSAIRCVRCHTTLAGIPMPFSGNCADASGTFSCARCHSCADFAPQHTQVPTFSSVCASPDGCYRCHPSGVGGGG